MRGRTKLLIGAAGGAVLLAILIALIGHAFTGPSAQAKAEARTKQLAREAVASGVDLGGAPTPSFSLNDQSGQPVSVASLKGHPVVLTFFDSVCPHADCSLMAEYINWTAQHLGARANDVEWVAISVDPWHDTPTTAKAFLQSRQVTLPMRYLLGSLDQLTPIWNDFHMQAIEQNDGVVIHTTGVYVLDAQGNERLYLDEGFDPQALAAYLQEMLSQHGSVPSSTHSAGQPAGEVVVSKTVNGDVVSLTAIPQNFGTYAFTVEALDAQGKPLQGATVTLDMTMTAMAMTPLHVTLGASNPPIPGTYQAQGVLSMLGQWQATVTIQPQDGSPAIHAAFTFTVTH
ncbi:MAG TPA: SCO family protein [Ktedonobacterales bacterium]|nr:SCO family protein [Ktedonobacterales bacterium]